MLLGRARMAAAEFWRDGGALDVVVVDAAEGCSPGGPSARTTVGPAGGPAASCRRSFSALGAVSKALLSEWGCRPCDGLSVIGLLLLTGTVGGFFFACGIVAFRFGVPPVVAPVGVLGDFGGECGTSALTVSPSFFPFILVSCSLSRFSASGHRRSCSLSLSCVAIAAPLLLGEKISLRGNVFVCVCVCV